MNRTDLDGLLDTMDSCDFPKYLINCKFSVVMTMETTLSSTTQDNFITARYASHITKRSTLVENLYNTIANY